MNVILKKITGGTAIRTDITVGYCFAMPSIGQSFEMFSESLSDSKAVRCITTSKVQKITADGNYIVIETLNSTYKLEIK